MQEENVKFRNWPDVVNIKQALSILAGSLKENTMVCTPERKITSLCGGDYQKISDNLRSGAEISCAWSTKSIYPCPEGQICVT